MSQGFAREARIGVDLHVGETLYYTADGTFDKADHEGLYGVRVQVQGAGGAGGGVAGGADGAGGGGGGGGYAEGIIVAADLSSSETVTVGEGGTGSSGGNGNGGGESSFGSHATGTGGSGGQTGRIRGEHGIGTGGDIQRDGGTGGPGIAYGGAFFEQLGGWGGDSPLGAVTTVASAPGVNSSLAGIIGGRWGGGGSGAASRGASSGSAAGGDGRDGIVIVEVLYERKIAVDEDIHTQYLNDTRHDTAHQGATLSLGSNQSISDSTVTQVTFDTTEYDDASLVSGATFVIPTGWERVDVNAIITFGSDATGRRVMRIEQDDVAVARNDAGAVSGGVTTMAATALGVEVSAGDVFDVVVFQDSGDPLNVAADAISTVTRFSIRRAK